MSSQGGQAGYITDMLTEAADPAEGSSEIVKFYAGCNVLITGASGFLGMLLVEKLLRSCPDVAKIFMLMRAKKGRSPAERFEKYFEDTLFDRLKREQPKYAKKTVMVEGDVSELNLGLSPENRKLLLETNIVIHGAATVRFDAKIRSAVNINVRGTKILLQLANEMTNLKAFVHISTAYCQCVNKEIDEKFYPPPINPDKIIFLVDLLDDAMLDHMTPVLLGKWPNTYAFTKAIAEDTVRIYGSELPVCIVRPSIITATNEEPIAGWINNIYGVTGVMVGVGVGLLHTMRNNEDAIADMIPADYVVNLIVTAAWDSANTEHELPFYNVVSSCQNPISWKHVIDKCIMLRGKVNPEVMIWYPFLITTNIVWIHAIYAFFLHLVPAAFADSLLYVSGRKPILWNIYQKIHKFSEVLSYFSTQQWKFHNRTVSALWDKIGPTDRSIFNFNLQQFNWDDYFYIYARGTSIYVLKETAETLRQGDAKYVKLRAAHYTIVMILVGLLLWIAVTFLRYLLF